MEYDPNNVEFKINGVAIDLMGSPAKKYFIFFNRDESGTEEFKRTKELYEQSSDKSVTICGISFPVIEFDDEMTCIVIDDTFNRLVGGSNLL